MAIYAKTPPPTTVKKLKSKARWHPESISESSSKREPHKVKRSWKHPDFWTVSNNYRGKWCRVLHYTLHMLIRRSRAGERRVRRPRLLLLSHSAWLLYAGDTGVCVCVCARTILLCVSVGETLHVSVGEGRGVKHEKTHTHARTHNTETHTETASLVLVEDIMRWQNTNINLTGSHRML